ncbi:HtaA domain-containing protein [Arthrobacter sp. U41]|uniref:HtaA domain-containing protein n=1 Tax=Arthrobacter sp. U41 TaxID=1849032 RepID=UPI001642A962|nr:HtaA domain-containing protein [Arthrobacter sp. U41]
MNPASASPAPLPPLGLSWGIKRSFVDYIASLPDGSVSATDGATVSETSLFCFSPELSDYDVERGTGVLRFRGDVRLAGHHGMLLVRLLDPWVTFSSGSGVLSISTGADGGQDRTAVGFLSPSTPRATGGFLVWDHVEVVVSPDGSELFDGQYAAGQPMDPLVIRVPG